MGQSAGLEERQPLLRRKLVRRRVRDDGGGAPPAPPAPTRATYGERALTRVCAGIGNGLHAEPRLVSARRVGQAELLDLVEPDGFLILLSPVTVEGEDSPDEGQAGLLALDRAAFMALVEILTTGRLMKGERAARRATPTDAALLAGFIDQLLDLRRAEAEKQGLTVPECESPWQRGCLVADPRLLPALLEEGDFDVEQIDLALSHGSEARKGRLLLGLPAPAGSPASDAGDEGQGASAPGQEGEVWRAQVEAMVMAVPARLDAVLGRVAMPLEEALQLKPGSRLTLPISQLEEVRLETADHRLLALARLGQYRSMRALRLTSLTEAVLAPLPGMTAPADETKAVAFSAHRQGMKDPG